MFSLLMFFPFILRLINSLDLTQLNIGVWLSGAAYCEKEHYKTMKLGGPASGFLYKETLHDIRTDLQGYIGIITSTKTIYVVLRGSSSIMNWLDDFEVRQVPYTTYPECNCNVHYGFYRSALGVANKTINIVRELRKIYSMYSVLVTAHSYGASCGQLLAMELERSGIKTTIYNYGQPRVGDKMYSEFTNTVLGEYWRTTHNKDIVPHLPPIEGFGYLHSCREVFEDENGVLNECSEISCEDPKCADQYGLLDTNINDHSYYLSHYLSCEESIIY